MDSSGYTSDVFDWLSRHMRSTNRAIGRETVKELRIESLIDFGCGTADFIFGALEGGASNVRGYDFAVTAAQPFIEPSLLSLVTEADITRPMVMKEVQAAISIEVAEHLPESHSSAFIANLTKSASKFVILSAAPPDQDGHLHINCQPRQYWIEKVTSTGAWNHCSGIEQRLRERWGPYCQTATYLLRNLLVFTKGERCGSLS